MSENIKKLQFKIDLNLGFEIVDLADLYEKNKKWVTKVHRVNFQHILWFEESSPIHEIDFKPIQIKENSILFLNKGTVQKFDKDRSYVGKAILFTEEFFHQGENDIKFLKESLLFNNLFGITQFELSSEKPMLISLLNLMKNESVKERDGLQPQILKNFLNNFLLYSERELTLNKNLHFHTSNELNTVVKFTDILEKHYSVQRQVNFYTDQLFITEKRLNKATSKIFAKTPKEVIDERITLEAKRLLGYSDNNVKEISYSLGFEEPTFFVQYFKRNTKMTPMEFRENNRA